MYRGTRPSLPWRHDAPPSSLNHTPTAEMPIASREGSPGHVAIEWRHRPPAPGCHDERLGWSYSARFSSQVIPPSVEVNSPAGATPAYINPSASPGLIAQIRSSVQSLSSG